jgi:hypothetical protein
MFNFPIRQSSRVMQFGRNRAHPWKDLFDVPSREDSPYIRDCPARRPNKLRNVVLLAAARKKKSCSLAVSWIQGKHYVLGGDDGEVVKRLGEELEQDVSADEHNDEALASAGELLAGDLRKKKQQV